MSTPEQRAAETVSKLRCELDAAEKRLEEFHEILDRKNTIIRLLAMGDCTAAELTGEE